MLDFYGHFSEINNVWTIKLEKESKTMGEITCQY